MMYPAQTSLIPAHVALARFIEQGGPSASSGLYPYWYLGTTPFRYLTGPILPLLLVGLHKIFPAFSLFEIMFGLIAVFWLIGGVGVYLLVWSLQNLTPGVCRGRHTTPDVIAFFYLFGPIVPFLFRFSDGLYLIAFCLLPFALLGYLKFLRNGDQKSANYLTAAIVFIMLLDNSILPTLILGMAVVFLANFGWKKAGEKIKKTLLITVYSLLITTVWYSAMYWWQLLVAPSFAGKSLFKVIGQVGQLLPIALAITLAVISGKFISSKGRSVSGRKPKPKAKSSLSRFHRGSSTPTRGRASGLITNYSLLKFTFYWLFIFGFLTFIRFISDPDFWLDWAAYGTEIQLGLAISGGLAVNKLVTTYYKTQNHNSKLKTFYFLIVVFTFYFLLFTFISNKYIINTLQKDIAQTVEYKIGTQLSKIAKPGEKTFLSGATVFWLNASFDIAQVRGGVDQASVHPDWRQAAWEIREGKDIEKSLRWLGELKIDYLVVHLPESLEFYHDFKHPEKFEGVEGLKKIYDREGDRIYQVVN